MFFEFEEGNLMDRLIAWVIVLPCLAYFATLSFQPHSNPNIFGLPVALQHEQAFQVASFVFAVVIGVRIGAKWFLRSIEKIVQDAH